MTTEVGPTLIPRIDLIGDLGVGALLVFVMFLILTGRLVPENRVKEINRVHQEQLDRQQETVKVFRDALEISMQDTNNNIETLNNAVVSLNNTIETMVNMKDNQDDG